MPQPVAAPSGRPKRRLGALVLSGAVALFSLGACSSGGGSGSA